MMEQEEAIVVYTDGSCLGNPGPGGWAAILLYKGHKKIISGAVPHTTNNQMELTAALEALNAIKKPNARVIVHTDSMYLKDGIQHYIIKWRQNGWKTSTNKPVKNQQIWLEIDKISSTLQIEWRWVKAHDINPLNNEVDNIARKAAEDLTETKYNSDEDL